MLDKYGKSKSSLRGIPYKEGALVGSAKVILDGFSIKPMNSKSFSKMPRPAMHPAQLLPTLRRARRAFRGNSGQPKMIRRTSSRAILTKQHSLQSHNSSGNIFALTESSTFSDLTNTEKELNNSFIDKKAVFISTGNNANHKQGKQNNSHSRRLHTQLYYIQFLETNNISDPSKHPGNMRPLRHRASRVSFAHESLQSATTNDVFAPANPRTTNPARLKKLKRKESALQRSLSMTSDLDTSGVATVPLPAISEPGFPRPFYYWNSCAEANPIEDTLDRYRINTNIDQRQNAINCLGLSSNFKNKPWLKQVDIAVCIAKRNVTRQTVET